MTTITQPNKWPFAGEQVELVASSLTGNRVRYKLISRPFESALELYDAAKENYITPKGEIGCIVTPDVDGTYVVTCVDETVVPNAPHYSNDCSVGGYVGIETSTVNGTVSHTIIVGIPTKREIGFAPTKCLLTAYAHSDGASYGVLTDYAMDGYGIALSGATDDTAKQAIKATTVKTAVANLGGESYTGTASIMPWDSVISDDPVERCGWLRLKFNTHVIDTGPLQSHDSADSTNIVTVANCTVGDATSQIDLLNDIRTQLIAHYANATAHINADAVNTVPGPALTAFATLTERMTRCGALRAAYEAHRLYVSDIDYSAGQIVHSPPADGLNGILFWSTDIYPTTETQLVGHTNNLKTLYNAHRVQVTYSAASYHAAGGVGQSTVDSARPTDKQSLIDTVSALLDALQAHVTNVRYDTGEDAVYHTTADWSSRTDGIPRPKDFTSAMQCMELFEYLLNNHIAKGADVHISGSGADSFWYTAPTGIGTIHQAFYAASQSYLAAVPDNENTASTKLVMLGGFSKS